MSLAVRPTSALHTASPLPLSCNAQQQPLQNDKCFVSFLKRVSKESQRLVLMRQAKGKRRGLGKGQFFTRKQLYKLLSYCIYSLIKGPKLSLPFFRYASLGKLCPGGINIMGIGRAVGMQPLQGPRSTAQGLDSNAGGCCSSGH